MSQGLPFDPARIELLGRSDVFLDFLDDLARAARVQRPVLVIGERGTGKELAVARLHYLSERWDGPLVTLNCASLTPSLLESELFGHEAGAFTGAVARRVGKFEAACEGTLFLDEIATLDLAAQEKILRAVEYGVFERVGGSQVVQSDARVIGATNADLPSMAANGKFKRDLLDRLSFLVLTVPPLRQREDDILLLARKFASDMALELELDQSPEFSPQAERQLLSYPWPGNVRELKNVVERAVFNSGGDVRKVGFDPFQSPFRPRPDNAENADKAPAERAPAGEVGICPDACPDAQQAGVPRARAGKETDFSSSLPDQVERLKRTLMVNALQTSRYNQRKAAELLGLTYNQFRALYRKLELQPEAQEEQ